MCQTANLLYVPVGSRAVASSSTAPAGTAARLHTSTILQASSYRSRKSRVAEKANVEKRAERGRLAALNRPHIILGNRPGDESKWLNSDLAKTLLTEEQILAAPIPKPGPNPSFDQLQEQIPKYMNYGVGEKEKEMLFGTLPVLTVEATHLRTAAGGQLIPSYMEVQGAAAEATELKKASHLAALVDLRNANAGGIAYENRKRIVAAFSAPGKDGDTGRPEVQGKCSSPLGYARSLISFRCDTPITHVCPMFCLASFSCDLDIPDPELVGPFEQVQEGRCKSSKSEKTCSSESEDLEVSETS